MEPNADSEPWCDVCDQWPHAFDCPGPSAEKDARPLARDGKPGCPVTVWDGPYSMRCSLGASVGKCAYHGTFASVTPGDSNA